MKTKILSTELRTQKLEKRLNSFQSTSPVYKLNLIQVTYKYAMGVHYLIRENRKEVCITSSKENAIANFYHLVDRFCTDQIYSLL